MFANPLQPRMADVLCMQAVCITDPVLATQVLQSKVVDKLRFPYSFLDPVSPRPTVTSHVHLSSNVAMLPSWAYDG